MKLEPRHRQPLLLTALLLAVIMIIFAVLGFAAPKTEAVGQPAQPAAVALDSSTAEEVVDAEPLALGYSPCRWGYSGNRAWGYCNRGSYRIGSICNWWWGGSKSVGTAWNVYAPKTASVSCPFGSSLYTSGFFWGDGRLIAWIKG